MQSSIRVGLIHSIFSAHSSRTGSPAFMRALSAILLLLVMEGSGSMLFSQGAGVAASKTIRQDISHDTNRLSGPIDDSKLMVVANHHPQWANSSNRVREMAAGDRAPSLIMVLARSPQQEADFEALLARQQDPSSSDYHHWLTPAQIGERFGLSEHDVASVTGWLESEGLAVKYVSPSRIFLGFGGSVAQLEKAFHTAFGIYNVQGTERMSVGSDPLIPAELAPKVKAIRGMYAIDDQPFHEARSMHRSGDQSSPDLSLSNGDHFLTPQDFATIYDLPPPSGFGQTIGIVGRSRTDFADFDEFRQKTGSEFSNPVEIIPTALGGVDPGPAYTAPPPTGTSIDDQLEATLDVMRAGSVANDAQLDLVVATDASGGIGVSAQYLVQTTPVPVQTINISFGNCELNAGPAGVSFWDSLFQQAAGEGISVFVSSGDAGASGCDANFATPPATPKANSPNYICSSSYATCVGGTEFNDTGNPDEYWDTGNSIDLGSALSYIPEGVWNEPIDAKGVTHAASGGGGVSSVIATPSWQTGPGVPSARAGRYTPDLAFSASGHDGYFACFAAAGASCVPNADGEYDFEYFYGTSAAAPGMAGIAALLNQHIGVAQGNLNSLLYPLAASSPSTFHDVTVATSGVSGCVVTTPSLCNNSLPGPTGLSGGQPGYLVGAGYDEATGLGSLDVTKLLKNYVAPKTTPSIAFSVNPSVTTLQQVYVSIELTGRGSYPPTGLVTLSGGGYKSSPMALTDGNVVFIIPANALAVGKETLTASYTPDLAGAADYNPTTASTTVSVTLGVVITPTLLVVPGSYQVTIAQYLPVNFTVGVPSGDAPATGSLKLTSGSYSASFFTGDSGFASFTIPAQALATGKDVLTATYIPDQLSAALYHGATGSATVAVTAAAKLTPLVQVSVPSTAITSADPLYITVFVTPTLTGNNYQIPTGTVTLTSATNSASATALTTGSANFYFPPGSVPVGTDSFSSTYVPDSGSSAIYNGSTGSSTITVTAAPNPSFGIAGTGVSVAAGGATGNTSTVTVAPAGGFTGTVILTAAVTGSPANALYPPTVSFGSTGSVVIAGTTNGMATLTISTTAPTVCGQSSQRADTGPASGAPLFASGGAALAGVFLLGFSRSRRRRIFALLVLLVASEVGVTACGGGGGGKATCNVATPGTTAGSYTVTVTGTSGSLTSTGAVALTVE